MFPSVSPSFPFPGYFTVLPTEGREGRNSEKEPAPPVPKRKLTLLPAENKSDNGVPPLSPEAVIWLRAAAGGDPSSPAQAHPCCGAQPCRVPVLQLAPASHSKALTCPGKEVPGRINLQRHGPRGMKCWKVGGGYREVTPSYGDTPYHGRQKAKLPSTECCCTSRFSIQAEKQSSIVIS